MTIKTALVTGAGKRLGRAMAIYLGERGYDVAVHYSTSSDGAEDTAAAIRGAGRKAVTVKADLLDAGETDSLVDRAAEALGAPLTVLVNNASIFKHDTVETATRDLWHQNVVSNLQAPLFLTQAFAAQVPDPVFDDMDEPVAQGMVLNMVDQRVRKLTPHFMTYTLAKTGLWTMTQTAARGLAPRVRVNAIGPGPTLQAEGQGDEAYASQRASTVLKRGSNPEDICAALGYFLESPAITGQLLCVDGGQHLNWKTGDISGNGEDG